MCGVLRNILGLDLFHVSGLNVEVQILVEIRLREGQWETC